MFSYLILLDCFWFKKFKNCFIKNGKKQKIERYLNFLFFKLKIIYKVRPILFFYDALQKLRPVFILVPKRKSTRIYILPTYLIGRQQYSVALRWLVNSIKKSTYSTLLSEKIFLEFTLLLNIVEVANSTIVSNKSLLTDVILSTYNNTAFSSVLEIADSYKYKLSTYEVAAENRVFVHYRW
jgi:ribosomal protein S7